MSLKGLLNLSRSSTEVTSICSELRNGASQQMAYGLVGSQRTMVMSAICEDTGRPALVITESASEAERVALDIESWTGRPALVFPSLEVMPFEVVAQSHEQQSPRIMVLERLIGGDRPVVVAPMVALMRKLPPKEAFIATCLEMSVGERLELDSIALRLALGGYDRVDMVEGRGQFSIRGGIIDVYPLTSDNPIRLELFDDEIDSIRYFDVASQRSLDSIKAARIPPAREMVAVDEGVEAGLNRIYRDLSSATRRLDAQGKKNIAQRLRDKVTEHLERIEQNRSFEGLDHYAPYFYEKMSSLLDYMPEDTLVFIDEFTRLREVANDSEKIYGDMYSSLTDAGALLPQTVTIYYALDDAVESWRKRQAVYFSLLLRRIQHVNPQNILSMDSRQVQVFHGQWPVLIDEISKWKRGRRHIVLAASTEDRARRLASQLREEGIENLLVPDLTSTPEPGVVHIVTAPLDSGFEMPLLRLTVVTDAEVYGRQRRPRRTRQGKDTARLTDYRELRVGDYVVHESHGIGMYMGIRTLEIEKVQRDYLFVKYSGADALYVPTDQIHMIQKYVGAEGHEPKLNRLGGTEWARVKHKVRESVREMARELLRLYAIRESVKGYAFASDTPWQAEFEDAFRYEETHDQLEATKTIKVDMEKPRPMDRLLVGDVGYGKTEVAIRAIFKAIMDGKQCAVLVPTTILAQQHFNTFKERFAGFPVKVAMVSRFLSAKEQSEVARAAKQGLVDVVVGTHRLLQADMGFEDLGLLVVDEEHRFGVAHKEQIKQLKNNVDVLTLSATPIPRTLSMALSGVRDMSLIETPPEDRFPVQTFVVERSEELIREAITREVSRGGQVFFVHNKVQSIERVASELQSLVPQCRIGIGHGQMKEDKLEQVMLDFINNEYDVLVCTTIIESGLDIPNANTMIVDDADHLGLAQLYQLRGRVGRSNRIAYAYFTYRREKVLSEIAEKRLQAIRELTELGSGFKLAMRDLEIRGAGNVLGAEQSGFIVSIGFDLYVQLLDEAIRELKGEVKAPEPPPIVIDVPVDAFISEDYVKDARQKIDLYKKIAAIETLEDADDVAEEIIDRYGNPPLAVQNLLAVSRVKIRARQLGLRSISQEKDRLIFKFLPQDRRRMEAITGYLRTMRGRFAITATRAPIVAMRLDSPKLALGAAEQLLRRLTELFE